MACTEIQQSDGDNDMALLCRRRSLASSKTRRSASCWEPSQEKSARNAGSIDTMEVEKEWIIYLKERGLIIDGKAVEKSVGANLGDCGGHKENSVVDDPDYKWFLENARGDGKEVIFEVEADKGSSIQLKYYKPERMPGGMIPQKLKGASRETQIVKAKGPKNVPRKRKRVMASSRVTESFRKEPIQYVDSSTKHNRESIAWDDSYMAYLLCLRNDGDVKIYTPTSTQVRYEEKEEEEEEEAESSSSSVEILSVEDINHFEGNNTFVSSMPLTIIDADGDLGDLPGETNPSKFRKEIIDKLRIPYDAMEYKSLLREAKHRRLKESERRLRRSRDVSYKTESTCKSYLDLYPELAKKINSAHGDRPRILNLLRGFFFWLHNLPHDGVFQPWKDRECLSILPQIKAGSPAEKFLRLPNA